MTGAEKAFRELAIADRMPAPSAGLGPIRTLHCAHSTRHRNPPWIDQERR